MSKLKYLGQRVELENELNEGLRGVYFDYRISASTIDLTAAAAKPRARLTEEEWRGLAHEYLSGELEEKNTAMEKRIRQEIWTSPTPSRVRFDVSLFRGRDDIDAQVEAFSDISEVEIILDNREEKERRR